MTSVKHICTFLCLFQLSSLSSSVYADNDYCGWLYEYVKEVQVGNLTVIKGCKGEHCAGIDHSTPHCLRHMSITEGVHAPNGNVEVISMVAGDKNLKTTMRYVHTADDRLHQAVANLPTIGTLVKDRADR